MFTGIVTGQGTLLEREQRGDDMRLCLSAPDDVMTGARAGDSVSVSGVCLTMIEPGDGRFYADVSTETLDCTTLGELQVGDSVNLEPALRASDRLGGHLVSGHVDGLGRVVLRSPDGRAERWVFEVPAELSRYVAVKGSICVDGISLTVNEVDGPRFGVCIIPHTAEVTTLGDRQTGDAVNIEVDQLARYLERLLHSRQEGQA